MLRPSVGVGLLFCISFYLQEKNQFESRLLAVVESALIYGYDLIFRDKELSGYSPLNCFF